MKYQGLRNRRIPDAPGVYFFYGPRKKVLYIGRATSLRDRVRSYFSGDIEMARGAWIAEMVAKARSVGWEKTDSVLEAVIREAALIKKHTPLYNTEGKDDKSFNYLVITKEEYPRVLVVRGRDLLKKKFTERDIKYCFGPFPSGGVFKEALRIVRKIFPFRDRCIPPRPASGMPDAGRGKPCFNRQIGLCPGVCTGEVTKQEYARTTRHLKLFFEGKKKRLITVLEREMRVHAKKQEFEKAARTKRQIFALSHIHDVALIKNRDEKKGFFNGSADIGMAETGVSRSNRIEGYDVAHIGGTATVAGMVVVEDGEPKRSDYRKFRIRSEKKGSDTDALKEVLRRRFTHDEWPLPDVIVLDGGKAQQNAAKRVLDEYGYRIPLVSVVKDERHRPREIIGNARVHAEREADILLANAEAHRFALSYHRKRRVIQ